MNQPAALPSAHAAFDAVRQESIESLNIRVEQYRHRATGALHYHLAADNTENVFLVGLRTVPEDSTGVAHILEHTALCGSRRYPVRDPFFMMLRRSLNTFMNAFTSSDWTAYPFASQNRKDFANLLDVYLDAVFFSRLDPLDFAQEGHRVEFAEPDNPDSDLVFKGVVFNEMKGAMSAISSTLWNLLCEHLFPTSTYHFNSGGDPEHIPDLSYEQLQAFYRSHYHPSNAVFMTFGDIGAAEHQAVFEERALRHFSRSSDRIEVSAEQRLSQPLRVHEHYAFDENEGTNNRTHLVMGWMLGESADLEQMLEAQLLSSVLLDNSASPLQQALETTDLGRSPSPLCGLEDSMRELVFCCGIEGSEADHAEAFEALVLSVLERVATEGVSLERLEAVLHQLELHQREVSGDSYPYGLQLILQALGAAIHYSDPIAVLNLDPVIASLRRKIQDPDYIKRLARTLLLDNPHRVTLTVSPDKELSNRRRETEKARLRDLKAAMSDDDKAATVQLAADLIARQAQQDDDSVLPRVELSDVPPTIPDLEFELEERQGHTFTRYSQGTNGIAYLQAILPLPELNREQQRMLPLYANALTEVGIGAASYLEVQERQAANVGAISAFASLRGTVEDEQAVSANFVLSSKALQQRAEHAVQLMADTLASPRFDELDRIRDLVNQQRARREQSVTGSGHGLAMAAASAGMSPLALLQHEQTGLEGLRRLRALDDSLADRDALARFAAQLGELHAVISGQRAQFLAIAESGRVEELVDITARLWPPLEQGHAQAFSLPAIRERRGQLWVTNTQVNFCAKAYPTVPVGHADAAPLTVLGGMLRNGYLHRTIREQGGAYGGGASQDSGVAAFRFYSYRDPRLEETLTDFDQSVMWLLDNRHDYRSLEEAILGVISSIDKPSSPAGEAKQHFHNRLFGRSHDQRELFRQQVLAVTLDDLRRVSETYLRPELASTAVITSPGQLDSTRDLRDALALSVEEL